MMTMHCGGCGITKTKTSKQRQIICHKINIFVISCFNCTFMFPIHQQGDIHPMLDQWRASAVDGSPALIRH